MHQWHIQQETFEKMTEDAPRCPKMPQNAHGVPETKDHVLKMDKVKNFDFFILLWQNCLHFAFDCTVNCRQQVWLLKTAGKWYFHSVPRYQASVSLVCTESPFTSFSKLFTANDHPC